MYMNKEIILDFLIHKNEELKKKGFVSTLDLLIEQMREVKEPRYFKTIKEAERYYRDGSDIMDEEAIDPESFQDWLQVNNATIKEVEDDTKDDYQDMNKLR